MKNKSLGKNKTPESLRETLRPSSRSAPAAVGAGLSPFEIEAGKSASPGSPETQNLGGPSGTISPAGKVPINPRVAGQLLNLPFKCLHIAYPVAQPLTEGELEAMAEPFSDFLVENGLESIGRSSVVLGLHLFIAGYSRVKAIADWKKEQKNAKIEKPVVNQRPTGEEEKRE